MIHHQEANLPGELAQLLCDPEAGECCLATVLRVLLNEAMRIKRAAALQARL